MKRLRCVHGVVKMQQVLEASNILLMNSQQRMNDYNRYRMDVLDACHTYMLDFPNLPEFPMAYMMFAHMPYSRWEHIILSIFPGMEPPIVKNKDKYMYSFIPEATMTPPQRKRAMDMCMCLSGAVWAHLGHSERVYICGVVHGMAKNMEHIRHMLHKLINSENPDEAVSKKRARTY